MKEAGWVYDLGREDVWFLLWGGHVLAVLLRSCVWVLAGEAPCLGRTSFWGELGGCLGWDKASVPMACKGWGEGTCACNSPLDAGVADMWGSAAGGGGDCTSRPWGGEQGVDVPRCWRAGKDFGSCVPRLFAGRGAHSPGLSFGEREVAVESYKLFLPPSSWHPLPFSGSDASPNRAFGAARQASSFG